MKSIALVIGENNYLHQQPLPATEKDANDVSVQKRNFEVLGW